MFDYFLTLKILRMFFFLTTSTKIKLKDHNNSNYSIPNQRYDNLPIIYIVSG